jgi:16S rRNA (guanine1207-N2)-methyltransferase
VALRLPRSREELVMALHAGASGLKPGGVCLLYGAKDEGIRSASGIMDEVFRGAGTLGVGGHCRVLHGLRQEGSEGFLGGLEAWRTVVDPGYVELGDKWVSYPGVFAHGRLDAGTRILLDALPPLPPGARVLDYGCGSGPVAAVAGRRGEDLVLELLDVDAVALEAARENVPGATTRLTEGLPDPGGKPFDAIFSNPPFHRGKEEDPGLVLELIRGARALLARGGVLVFVTQRRLRVEEEMTRAFQRATVLAEDPVFRVWEGRGPR